MPLGKEPANPVISGLAGSASCVWLICFLSFSIVQYRPDFGFTLVAVQREVANHCINHLYYGRFGSAMVGIVSHYLTNGVQFTFDFGIMILNHGRVERIVRGSGFVVGHKHLTQDQAWRRWSRQRTRHN